MPKIKAVIFDCVTTLIKPDENSNSEINKTLTGLSVPYYFVTNGNNETKKLQQLGKNSYFKGRIFEVPNSEIKHNTFYKIAQKMQIKNNECLVIEDNMNGTIGASALDMKILAYLGKDTKFTDYSSLRLAGAWGLLDDMDWLLFLTSQEKKSGR